MGSISRYSAIDRFTTTFGERIEEHFNYLKDATATSVSNYQVDYHVSADITLDTVDGEETFETHLRWTTEEETYEGREIDEDDEDGEVSTYSDYLSSHVVGKKVTKLFVNHDDRDDEVYLHLRFGDEHSVAIPLGFDPEHMEISGFAEGFISEEEFEAFCEE